MKIKNLRNDLIKYLKEHHLSTKYEKAKTLFENDPLHPSDIRRFPPAGCLYL